MKSADLRLTYVRFEAGERYPILLGPDGTPAWYPTLFATINFRNASKSPQTTYAALSAVRHTIRWAESIGLDLVTRFQRREFLTTTEIEALVAALRQKAANETLAIDPAASPKGVRRLESSRVRAPQPSGTLSRGYVYARISYTAQYIQWLSRRVVEEVAQGVDEETDKRIALMVRTLLSNRPSVRRRGGNNLKKAQPIEEEIALLDVAQVDHSDNPFSEPTALRNLLIIMMLDELGLRAGELLSVKVKDIDFQEQTIVIERRHHDAEDPRSNQPVVKTLDRRLPISDELTIVLTEYILRYRGKLRLARRHPMLLVSTRNSGSGKAGDPMSRQALSLVTSKLSAKLSQGSRHVHPHLMRHNAATRMFRQLSEQKTPEARIVQLMEWKFGWAEGSGSARTYVESEVQKQSLKVQKELQDKWSKARSDISFRSNKQK